VAYKARLAQENLFITLFTSESGFEQASPGLTSLPQKPQVAPSLLRNGLCDAQVPLNSPFFRNNKRTDINTKNKPINAMPMSTVVMFTYFWSKLVLSTQTAIQSQ
jgi:hypothetical protein